LYSLTMDTALPMLPTSPCVCAQNGNGTVGNNVQRFVRSV
jgi:hypothetical protein